MQAYQGTIKSLIEKGYSADFLAESPEDQEEMRVLWKKIYALCLSILSSSMNLIYSGNQEIM
jgi:hypothetical protein